MLKRINMDDGSIIEVECNDEIWNGNYLRYFSNGKIHESGQYVNDKKVGKFLVYNNDLNNTLRKEVFYEDSIEPVSMVEYLHIDGNLISTCTYENNVLIEVKSFYDTGEIESVKNLKNNKVTSYDKNGNIIIDKYQIKSEKKFKFNNKGKFADIRDLIYKYSDNLDLINKNSNIFIGEDSLEQKFNISRLNQDLDNRNSKLKLFKEINNIFLSIV